MKLTLYVALQRAAGGDLPCQLAAINQLSDDVIPGSNTARFLIFSAVIVLAATTVIIATRGQLGRRTAARSGRRDSW
jgi:hypothetical protein